MQGCRLAIAIAYLRAHCDLAPRCARVGKSPFASLRAITLGIFS